MAVSGINRLRSVTNDFTLYGGQQKPEKKEDDEEKDVLARLANAKRNNVASTAATKEPDVLERLNRTKSAFSPSAPQPVKSEPASTPEFEGRLRPGWSAEDVEKATESGKTPYQKALDGIGQVKALTADGDELEAKLKKYDLSARMTGGLMSSLAQTISGAEQAFKQSEAAYDKFDQKLKILSDVIDDPKADQQTKIKAAQEYNALVPYAQKAAQRLNTQAGAYNAVTSQLSGLQTRFDEARTGYEEALSQYTEVQKRGDVQAKNYNKQAQEQISKAKAAESEVEGREALHPNFSSMTPAQVGAWQQENFDLLGTAQEANAKARDLMGKANRAQARFEDYQYSQLMAPIKQFSQRADWAAKSAADESKLHAQARYGTFGNYIDSGYEDIDYAIINGDEDAFNESLRQGGIDSLGGLDKSYLKQMTDQERQLYNYYYSQSASKAKEFLDKLTPRLNERQRGADRKKWEQLTAADPVGASAFSVLVSPAKAVSYFGQLADLVANGKIDQNAAYNRFSTIPGTIRDTVSKTVSSKWGEPGSFLYQTGMSMADFLFNTAIGGGFAGIESVPLAIMGTGAAVDTVIDLKDRGVDDTRAFALGTIAGLAEIVTEKISMENLLNPDKLADGILRYILKNMAAEGSEELSSDLINWAADALYDLVSGQDEAEWKYNVRQLVAKGMSSRAATQKVMLDMVKQAGLDALGGALSGGVMAGAGAPIQLAVNAGQAAGQAVGDYISGVREDIASARQMTNTVYDTPLAQQAVEAPALVEAPIETRSALQAAVDKLTAGQQLSEKDAKAIMNDPQAMQTLRDAGLPETLRPGAEGRAQVRQAVEQYAQQMQAGEPTVSQESAPATQEVQTQAEQQNAPQATQDSTRGIRLKTAEETLTPAPKPVNLLAQNRTEVNNNGTQTPAPAPAAETRTTEQRTATEQSFA